MIHRVFRNFSRDTSYDHRKLVNGEEMICVAKSLGYTQAQIAEMCDVSTTMVSHWANHNRPERPTFRQLEPMFDRCGRGRFRYEMEPLPPSAIEYPPIKVFLVRLFLTVVLGGGIWFIFLKPCVDKWQECKTLEWYQMGVFELIQATNLMEQSKGWDQSDSKKTEQ